MKEKFNVVWGKIKDEGAKFVKSKYANYLVGLFIGYFAARCDFIFALNKAAKTLKEMEN